MKKNFINTRYINKQTFKKQALHLSNSFNKPTKFINVRKFQATSILNNIPKTNTFIQRNCNNTNFVIPKITNISNYYQRKFANYTKNRNEFQDTIKYCGDFRDNLTNGKIMIENNNNQHMRTLGETQKLANKFQQMINNNAFGPKEIYIVSMYIIDKIKQVPIQKLFKR